MTHYSVVIPFRDRGIDPLRMANLQRVQRHWMPYAPVVIIGDGRQGNEQFNRCAAYNRGVASCPDAEVFVFAESDMLVDRAQVDDAIGLAARSPGLVVPFTEYRYLSEDDSRDVRNGLSPRGIEPESVIPNEQRSWPRTGPLNVLSRRTLDMVGGWDEQFEGNWWDDRAMKRAFDVAVGPTRFVTGPAYHLYHLPGWTGAHLSAEDRAAAERNRHRFMLYQQATTPQQIRQLTSGEGVISGGTRQGSNP